MLVLQFQHGAYLGMYVTMRKIRRTKREEAWNKRRENMMGVSYS